MCFWPVRLDGRLNSLVRKKNPEKVFSLGKMGKVMSLMVHTCGGGLFEARGR